MKKGPLFFFADYGRITINRRERYGMMSPATPALIWIDFY